MLSTNDVENTYTALHYLEEFFCIFLVFKVYQRSPPNY